MTIQSSVPAGEDLDRQLAAADPDVLRLMVKSIAEALMSTEAGEACGAPCGQVSSERTAVSPVRGQRATGSSADRGERLRRGNGESSCYLGSDGRWHGRVSVGLKLDGSPDQRHVSGRDRDTVLEQIEKLHALRDAGKVVVPGRVPTVAAWMRTWLDTIAPRTAQQNTVDEIYRPKVERWIIPALGRHRLDRLQPPHLDEFYTACAKADLSTRSVLLLHQIVSRALKMALRREQVQRNVATLVDAPRHRDAEVEPLRQAEARARLDLARSIRNGARWSVALALGLRQNEALGMRRGCVDLEAGTVRVFQIKRLRYRHGCLDLAVCGAGHHVRACKNPCMRHLSRCPKPCARGCVLHAQFCPQRAGGEWVFKQPKGGKARTLVIPQPLVLLLVEARRLQEKEKAAAGDAWTEWDLCFPDGLGNPQETRDDWADWKRLCAQAGVRVVRLLSRSGARFRCCHRPVSPDRSPNPPCRSLGNGLSTVSAVRRGS